MCEILCNLSVAEAFFTTRTSRTCLLKHRLKNLSTPTKPQSPEEGGTPAYERGGDARRLA